jgi:hypothetical protein
MAEFLIKLGNLAGGQYPAELFEVRPDGAPPVSQSAGPLGTIDLLRTGYALIGNTPDSGLLPIGTALYTALFAALGQPLRKVMDGPPATIYLEIGPNELINLPWELLVWQREIPGGLAQPVYVTSAHHLTRIFAADWAAVPPDPEGPLRVLIVLGSLLDDPKVKPRDEIEKIKASLHPVRGLIDIDIVEAYPLLYDRIKSYRPHVLHFIGHGTNNPPSLLFSMHPAQSGEPEVPTKSWTSGDIATDVGGFALKGWRPRLVILNACRSAAAAESADAGTLGPLAGAFLCAEVPATIAMQGDINGVAAGLFAGKFYKYLASGSSPEQALSQARVYVRQQYGEKQASFPALTLRRRPGAILPGFRFCIANYEAKAATCTLLPNLSVFVNQVEPRRSVCDSLWPVKPETPRQNFIVLRGNGGVGKTVLSTWLLHVSANLGHRVRYVDVGASANGVDCITIAGLIWGVAGPAQGISPLREVLPLQPEAELREMLKGKDPELLYIAYRKALSTLASSCPVTIVLDNFQKMMDPEQFWKMWTYLFLKLPDAEMENVTFIVCLDEQEYQDFGVESPRPELIAPKREVKLGLLSKDQFVKLLPEYLYYRNAFFRRYFELLKPVVAAMDMPSHSLSMSTLEQSAEGFARGFLMKLEPPCYAGALSDE